ncbi:MAG: hypothetical protein E6K92_02410 [Thaumarchaeota archaeon]|nr:MAG: hypothetical protein E6K92_02410 [Nitrososphaerota archaeon]
MAPRREPPRVRVVRARVLGEYWRFEGSFSPCELIRRRGRGIRVSRTIKIQNLEVKSGQKKRGTLSISEKPAGPHQIPYTVVNGAGDGPTLLVNGGIDGSEYNGPAGTLRLQAELDASQVKGTVIIVPVVNTLAFEARWVYTNPVDYRGLSGAYVREIPRGGSGHPLISYQVAKAFYDNILSKAEYRLDLHGGDIIEDLLISTMYTRFGENRKRDDAAFALARNFGWVWIREGTPRPGAKPPYEGQPVPITMGTEAGGSGRCQSDIVDMVFKGITNVMKHLGMLKGKPDIPKKAKVYRPYHIYSERGGFFISDVRAGDMVRKGQVIGEIRNLYGDVVEKITVPQPGVIHMVTSPAIYQGDALFEIGTDIREEE